MGTKLKAKEATRLFLVDTVWILLTVTTLVFLTGIAYLILAGQGYPADTIRWVVLLIATLIAASSVYLLKRDSSLDRNGKTREQQRIEMAEQRAAELEALVARYRERFGELPE